MGVTVSCSILNFINAHFDDERLFQITLNALPIISKSGYKNVELYLRTLNKYQIKRLKSELKIHGLKVNSIHFYKNVFNRDDSLIVSELYRALEATKIFDSPILVIHPPSRGTFNEKQKKLCKVLQPVILRAEQVNTQVTLENLYDAQSIRLLEDVKACFNGDWLGFTLDLKFLGASKIKIDSLSKQFLQNLINVHVNDYLGYLKKGNKQKVYPLLGEGCVNFGQVATVLKSINYSGVLTLEVCVVECADIIQELTRSRVFLESLLV